MRTSGTVALIVGLILVLLGVGMNLDGLVAFAAFIVFLAVFVIRTAPGGADEDSTN